MSTTWRKYGNISKKQGRIVYDSKLEAQHAMWLESLEREGRIENLERQVRMDIRVNGKHICNAFVDFRFTVNGRTVWLEVKGFPTDVYNLKKKLIHAVLPAEERYLVNPDEATIFKSNHQFN